jgi:hypothetical protein
MDNEDFNLVGQILSSEKFESSSDEEQQTIISQIQSNGISLETIQQIQQLMEQEKKEKTEQAKIQRETKEAEYFSMMPYDVFLSIVRKGQINGQNLLNLCNASTKVKEYCDKPLILQNGQIITKNLFRILLNDLGIKVDVDEDPKEVYINHVKFKGFSTPDLLELAIAIVTQQ